MSGSAMTLMIDFDTTSGSDNDCQLNSISNSLCAGVSLERIISTVEIVFALAPKVLVGVK